MYDKNCALGFLAAICTCNYGNDVKVGLYFWRIQAPHTPPRSALVRGISWRVPIGVSMRKRLGKKYKPTRVHKRWQKLNDFQDTGLKNVY